MTPLIKFAFVAATAAALALCGGLPLRAQEPMLSGWWVVVGALPLDNLETEQTQALHRKMATCGFTAFNDISSKFVGFASGYEVYVLGAYAVKAEAAAVLVAAKRCVPDAYIKHGRYLGE